MSSTDPSGTERLVDAFLDEHNVGSEMREALLALLHRAVTNAPTQMRPKVNSLPTLVLPDDAPDTLQSLVSDDPAPAPPVSTDPLPTATPLVTLALLGRGGMGEVHRAQDPSLNRRLAMKVLHPQYRDVATMRARFLAEAQITAQLAHPAIPPVHAVGELPSGQPYFTMKEVHGRTLSDTIWQIHRGTSSHWTEARVLDVFVKVCEAVAYAHARGVIHCDLKPSNVMVGAFGEVMVMDWGVARLVQPSRQSQEGPVQLDSRAKPPKPGAIAGTPAYMPPEQGSGDTARVGPASDVYALGVMLFELLSGKRPYTGNPMQLLMQSSRGQVPEIELPSGSKADESLVQIIHKSMRPNPDERYSDAGALAADIARWREGSLRREKALAEVHAARAMLPDISPKQERARLLRELAEQRLTGLGEAATADAKVPAWALEEEAEQLELEASLKMVEVTQKLHGALAHAPDLPEAHQLLAQIHFERHQTAEATRDIAEAARQEVLLRAHDQGTYADYLAARTTLTLATEPPCQVKLFRFANRGRRFELEWLRDLGKTPLVDVDLPIGSYLLELRAPDRPVIHYPVQLRRSEPWELRPPGMTEAIAIRLPEAGVLRDGERFVPGGWYRMGGDPDAPGGLRSQKVWVDSFVAMTHPVTAQEFFAWLGDGHPAAQRARAAVLRSGVSVHRHDWPMVGITWEHARAFARWYAERKRLDYRLPTEVEWEKAARGVDGRWYPWGDGLDSAFAHVRSGTSTPAAPRSVLANESDLSVYGLMGMAGNVREWCLDPFVPEHPPSLSNRRNVEPSTSDRSVRRAVRGGSWRTPADTARVASRAGLRADTAYPDVGFRLVRPL